MRGPLKAGVAISPFRKTQISRLLRRFAPRNDSGRIVIARLHEGKPRNLSL